VIVVVVVSVEAKLSFVEPGRRWAHSPFSGGAPGILYQGTMKTSVRMIGTSGGLSLLCKELRWGVEKVYPRFWFSLLHSGRSSIGNVGLFHPPHYSYRNQVCLQAPED